MQYYIIICFDVKEFINFGINQILCEIVSDLQLFVDKSLFLEEKAHFLGVKQPTSVLVKCKKTCFLLKFAAKFLVF